jgi:hypothetical protein
MTKLTFIIASSLTFAVAANFGASAQQFPLGSTLQMFNQGASSPPRQAQPQNMNGSASATGQKRRPTHIIPPQSPNKGRYHPRETSAPSEDND